MLVVLFEVMFACSVSGGEATDLAYVYTPNIDFGFLPTKPRALLRGPNNLSTLFVQYQGGARKQLLTLVRRKGS